MSRVAKRPVDLPQGVTASVAANVVKVLRDEGYVAGYNVTSDGAKQTLSIELKYFDGRPVIDRLERVSRPGLRIYRGKTELPKIQGGLGTAIVSTPKGVMTGRQARKAGVGGEVLCDIW